MKTINYNYQAEDFLYKTKTEFSAEFLKNDKHFVDDKDTRDIYKITLKRGERKFTFAFGQSIVKSKYFKDKKNNNIFSASGRGINCNLKIYEDKKEKYFEDYCQELKGESPLEYDVLVCLAKYDPGTFEDFCSDFGYDVDSKKVERIYKDVLNEWENVQKLWNDKELEQLREIQ